MVKNTKNFENRSKVGSKCLCRKIVSGFNRVLQDSKLSVSGSRVSPIISNFSLVLTSKIDFVLHHLNHYLRLGI
ncbi:hypothetical protein G4B88_008057 [Cannabis sativa]|uniref:Uncharacterized protein n=1 Tax=Cannabis sativa TaxID=3483 RepID=A0A7J6I8M3_CANSA|nr:hypothetical protein G4B88_008057 [Cannabis sativa]